MTKSDLLRTFLEQRGVRVPQRMGWAKISCINSAGHLRGDRNPSASINLTTGRYNCFACGLAGSAYDLYMHENGVDFATAKRMLGGMESHTPEPTWL